jgi:S-adenosylmethionine:tRNA ribosyltransferase-isomerase
MKPARWPRSDALSERLLWIDPASGAFGDATVEALTKLPRRGDLLVVNDAATLPASLVGATAEGTPLELRLVAREGDDDRVWRCVVFGAGDWRTKTELRAAPPPLPAGTQLRLGADLSASVVERLAPRLVTVRFDMSGDRLWSAIYRAGRPVQYSYLDGPLELFHVQTSYASRPWSVEMPSAGRPLKWSVLLGLRARGVGLARVTHAAGLSSTGDATLDASLPWPERYDIPEETVDAVSATRRSGGRVIAVGTSVVRALEGAARENRGELVAGAGRTNLVLGPGFVPRIVSGIFTGIHEATATHFALLQAFVGRPLLERAYAHAESVGYLGHELGDSCLILDGVAASYPTSR